MRRLVRLRLLNLNGNPLGARLAEGGPTLREVWLGGGEGGEAGEAAAGGVQQQGGSSGGDVGGGDAAAAARRRAGAAQPAAEAAELRRRTGRVMCHLLELQVRRACAHPAYSAYAHAARRCGTHDW